MLARLCSKSFKLGLSNTWTKNFQMYKLSLGKAQELEIKLPTSTESWRKQGNSRKASILKPLTVWTTTNWKILKKIGVTDHLTCLLRNLYGNQEATVQTRYGTMGSFDIGKGERQSCILSPCLFNIYGEYIMWNARLDEPQSGIKIAGRNPAIPTEIQQIQQPLMCRWYHSNSRKWRGTKKPLDESERWELKSWLKTQHSKN